MEAWPVGRCQNDGSFGPAVVGCRDNFDFTQLFELSIFSIAPSATFILLASARLSRLHGPGGESVVDGGRACQAVKLGAAVVYAALQTALLVLACTTADSEDDGGSSSSSGIANLTFVSDTLGRAGGSDLQRTRVAGPTLGLVASILILPLSVLEHSRSLKPSVVLAAYLLFTLVLDAARVRTQWLLASPRLAPRVVLTASLCLKAMMVVLESQKKTRWTAAESPARRNPELTGGIFSKGLYYWMNDLVRRGYRASLGMEDLYDLDTKIGAERYQNLVSQGSTGSGTSIDLNSGKPKNRLLWAALWSLKGAFLSPVFPRLALIGFTFSQPFFIEAVLNYIQAGPGATPRSHGYGLIGAAAAIYPGMAVASGLYWYAHGRALCKFRAYLVVALYAKTVTKNAWDEGNSSAITLMNSDVMGIQGGFRDLHELWASAIETAIAGWLLHRQVGAAFVVPVIIVLVCTGLTTGLGKFTGKRFMASMKMLQKRVAVSSAVIPCLPAIKASAMAGMAGRLIQGYRMDQIAAMKRFRYLSTVSVVFAFAPIILSPAVTFAFTMEGLNVARVFTSLAWINLLCQPMTQLLQSIPNMLAARASIQRIQTFLESESRMDRRSAMARRSIDESTVTNEIPHDGKKSGEKASKVMDDSNFSIVTVTDGTFGWKDDSPVLETVSLKFPKASCTLVLGPVASGKSTLCKALLGEAPGGLTGVSLPQPRPRLAYCDQDPVLFNTTIRENIIGFGVFNGPWYERVVQTCHLGDDISLLAGKDHTKVGTKGAVLSGGQKKRVGLARAVYHSPEIAILDDPLAGIDEPTARLMARDLFGPTGLFRELGTTTIVTAQSSITMPVMDRVVVLRDRKVAYEGPASGFDKSPVVLSMGGQIRSVAQSERHNDSSSLPTSTDFVAQPSRPTGPTQSTSPTSTSKPTGLGNYKYYFSALGYHGMALYMVVTSCFAFLFSFPAVWLSFWASANNGDGGESNPNTPFYLGVYFALQFLALAFLAFDVALLGIVLGPRASAGLHKRTLHTLLRAPLKYYSTVDGAIATGYLAQDMGIVDNELQGSLGNTLRTGMTVVAQAAVIATSSPYVLLGYPIVAGALFLVQKVYLRTSTQLRHLVLESKTPLFQHFTETVNSLVTIRAFGWQSSHIDLNNKLFDESQRPSYLMSMLQQWLNLVLSLSVACIAVIVVSLATQLRTSAGLTGVALVSLMSFGDMTSNLVRCYTELQTATAALSRLRGFGVEVRGEDDDLDLEGDGGPPRRWPTKGEIKLENVTASYDTATAYEGSKCIAEESKAEGREALKNVSLTVSPGERVLVTGRTGSGKSSLLLVLQGFLQPSKGDIRIDGIPIQTVPRSTLRSAIISLPQEPFFLPEGHSVRQNLEFHDHDTEYRDGDDLLQRPQDQDAECEYALGAVGLAGKLCRSRAPTNAEQEEEQEGQKQEGSGTDRGTGLDTPLRGETLSRGQKQLFSLARAIVRAKLRRPSAARQRNSHDGGDEDGGENGQNVPQSGILLLDEFNSGLDAEAAEAMWRIILREFAGYTVLGVAHLLPSVADFDKVVVLRRGEIMAVRSGLAYSDSEIQE